MKKLLFSLICLLSFYPSEAQTWFPIGATWYYNVEEGNNLHGYIKYEVVRDTLVNGLNSKIIAQKNVQYDGTTSYTGEFVCREENQQVYYLDNNTFTLMYDFNMQIGDSLKYLATRPNYGYNFCDTIWDAVLETVGTYYNTGLKKQTFKANFYDTSGGRYSGQFEFIERIGQFSVGELGGKEFFHPSKIICVMTNDSYSRWLRCYSDSTVAYKHPLMEGYSCDSLAQNLVSNINLKKEKILLSPNPTTGIVRLNNLPNGFQTIRILNIQGAVLREENSSTNSTELDLSAFPTGVYFISLTSEAGEVFTGKVLKL